MGSNSIGGITAARRNSVVHRLKFTVMAGMLLSCLHGGTPAFSQTVEYPFLTFIQEQARQSPGGARSEENAESWPARREELRARLLAAWGGFPDSPCPLEPRNLGTLKRDGYKIEKLILQTMPGVWMPANLYLPDGPGPFPAVLCVHGHWRTAKVSPHLQSRAIGLVKQGYVVLAVDALGAGERGLTAAGDEYHGEMVAATLLPVGKPLSGLQVYENMRAVDFLCSRPEVDPEKLGITGASGGGNQTMYAGAWDERFDAVVPVCSVGNYQAYLGAACCMCEVVPGALQFTEEAGVLGLVAPRGLMVISATADSIQFSPGEAKKSILGATPIFASNNQGKPNLLHVPIKSPHDYNQPMREAMYGWMALHLKGEGDGSPLPEPEHTVEAEDALRCFPGKGRPDSWITIPQLAKQWAEDQLAWTASQSGRAQWASRRSQLRETLDRELLGGTTPGEVPQHKPSRPDKIAFVSEPGIELELIPFSPESPRPNELVLLIDLEFPEDRHTEKLAASLAESGLSSFVLSPRAVGKHRYSRDRVGRAEDHNTAEWSLWLGRPLLGQWTLDVRAALTALSERQLLPENVTVVGQGPAGMVALTAGILDRRINRVVTIDSLASYLTDQPYEQQRLGNIVPGIVRDVGDIAQLAALLEDQDLLIIGGVNGQGKPLSLDALRNAYQFTADSLPAGRLQIREHNAQLEPSAILHEWLP